MNDNLLALETTKSAVTEVLLRSYVFNSRPAKPFPFCEVENLP